MPFTIILHIENADPVVGEVDDLPAPNDNIILIMNPRRLDGKDIHYLSENIVSVYWPVDKLNFIEVVSSKEEEEIIGFVRE